MPERASRGIPDTEPYPSTELPERKPESGPGFVPEHVLPMDEDGPAVEINLPDYETALHPVETIPEETVSFEEMADRRVKEELAGKRKAILRRRKKKIEEEEFAPPTLPSSGVRKIMERLTEKVPESTPPESAPAPSGPRSVKKGEVEEIVVTGTIKSTPETAPNVPSIIEEEEEKAA